MAQRVFAIGFLLTLAARAGAEDFPEFPTRYYASVAASIVLATPDRDARTFTVSSVLTGSLVKTGDVITADPGVYSLARRFEGIPTHHPLAALLFLEKNPDDGKSRIAMGGIRLLNDDKKVLTARQESNPGPYTFLPLTDATWENTLADVRNVSALAAEVRAIAALKPDAARNKAALAWITAHQDAMTGKVFSDPTERLEGAPPASGAKPGLGHVEWDAFAMLQRAPVPDDAWRAVVLWTALAPNDTGAVPGETDSIAFGSTQGRKILAAAAGDTTLPVPTRVAALRFLRVALVPNAVGQKRPTDAELESIEGSLIAALKAQDAPVILAAASILATFHEHYQVGGPDGRVVAAMTEAYNNAAPGEVKNALATDLHTLDQARR